MVKMIIPGKRHRVSIAMVIELLHEQCNTVADLRNSLSDAVGERDEMMVELKAAGVPDSKIVRITGLSLSMVTKVTAGARRGSLAF